MNILKMHGRIQGVQCQVNICLQYLKSKQGDVYIVCMEDGITYFSLTLLVLSKDADSHRISFIYELINGINHQQVYNYERIEDVVEITSSTTHSLRMFVY